MKIYLLPLLASIAVMLAVTGCESLFTKTASPESLPVEYGGATTNDPNIVAYLKLAQAINATANPTPTEIPINQVIGALIVLAGAASGFYGRHIAAAAATKNAATIVTASNQPPKTG